MVIAMSTEMSLQGTAQTENSTTKDTTDASGSVWDEFEVVSRSAVINFTALMAAGSDTAAMRFQDMLSKVNDVRVNWKIAVASGQNNRTMGTIIASGQGKLVNVQATGQVGQQATYSGSINIYGPMQTIHVASTSFNLPTPQALLSGLTNQSITLSDAIDADAFIQLVKFGYSDNYDEPTAYAELTQESGTVSVSIDDEHQFDLTVASDGKTWHMGNFNTSSAQSPYVWNAIFI
jgi:hypothetical protein